MKKSLLVLAALSLASAGAAEARIPPQWKNCAAVNKKYPHGLGKAKAADKTAGDPVTSFKRSDALYRLAITCNKSLDRDHDGIACEQP